MIVCILGAGLSSLTLAQALVNENIFVDLFTQKMIELVNSSSLNSSTLISNSRHLESLNLALENIVKTIYGLNDGISGDLLAMDIRQVLQHIGEITGEISSDELLKNIFSNFCIGK